MVLNEENLNEISTSPCSINGNNLVQNSSTNRNVLINSTSSSTSSNSNKLITSDVNIQSSSTSPGSAPIQKPIMNNSFLLKQGANSSININTNNNNNVSEKLSPGLAKRVTTSPITSLPNSQTNTATNIKIQNALDRNMQKLNLARQTNVINSKIKAANLTKEEIELFTNSVQTNLNFNSEHQNQFSLQNFSPNSEIDGMLTDQRESNSKSNKLR